MIPEQYESEPCLEIQNDQESRRVPLTGGAPCHIGRGDQNTIVLQDSRASRQHALVQATECGQFSIIDLGSRNGTFVNRRRVTTPLVLQPGDHIQIGGHEIVFRGSKRPTDPGGGTMGETVFGIDHYTITVLVVDIRDFTGLSSRLGDERLSEILSTFMREAGMLLDQNGSWSQKYIGDAVMSIWVHSSSSPDPGELTGVFRALHGLFDLAEGLQGRFNLDSSIRIGAGVNTGPASLGNLGSSAASDYTALSEAVNLAFRLESATKELECDVAVGESTHEILEQTGVLEGFFGRQMANLKGFREPKPAYSANRAAIAELIGQLSA